MARPVPCALPVSRKKNRPFWLNAIWSALFWTLALSCLSVYLIVFIEEKTNIHLSFPMAILLAVTIVGGLATLLLGLLTAGVISDRRRREPRHWLHWSAVVLSGLALIFVLVMVAIAIVKIY